MRPAVRAALLGLRDPLPYPGPISQSYPGRQGALRDGPGPDTASIQWMLTWEVWGQLPMAWAQLCALRTSTSWKDTVCPGRGRPGTRAAGALAGWCVGAGSSQARAPAAAPQQPRPPARVLSFQEDARSPFNPLETTLRGARESSHHHPLSQGLRSHLNFCRDGMKSSVCL